MSDSVAIVALVIALLAVIGASVALAYALPSSGSSPAPSPVGGDNCTQGPSYYCANDQNFAECIQSRGYNGTRDSFPACKPDSDEKVRAQVFNVPPHVARTLAQLNHK